MVGCLYSVVCFVRGGAVLLSDSFGIFSLEEFGSFGVFFWYRYLVGGGY